MPLAALSYCRYPGCREKIAHGLGGYCRVHAQVQEHRRSNWDVRRWYRTLRWKTLRADVLRETPLCEDCTVEGRIVLATDVHHRVKHHGDPEIFWDRDNLGALCASCHSVRTKRGE